MNFVVGVNLCTQAEASRRGVCLYVCVHEICSVTVEGVGGFVAGCSICLVVSIQGHFPKREAGLKTPPLSGATSADQGPPLVD